MRSQDLNNKIDAIDNYFRSKAAAYSVKCVNKLFVCTMDCVVGEKGNSKPNRKLAAYTQALGFNVLEFIKSKIKRRMSSYRLVEIIKSTTNDIIYINPHIGTAVVIGDKHVWKFYFKDIEYFTRVYNLLAEVSGYEMDQCDEFFLTIQPRHRKITRHSNDAAILHATQPQLIALHQLAMERSALLDLLLPQQKIRQLVGFYNQTQNRSCSQYIDLAISAEEKAWQYQKVICHGDLWAENIVEANNGATVLIDYDKTVLFVTAYDYVYYFLMSCVLTSRVRIEQLIKRITHYSHRAQEYLRNDCKGAIGVFTDNEIRLSIYLFALLKLVEQDLRHKRYGGSLGLLYEGLRAL